MLYEERKDGVDKRICIVFFLFVRVAWTKYELFASEKFRFRFPAPARPRESLGQLFLL